MSATIFCGTLAASAPRRGGKAGRRPERSVSAPFFTLAFALFFALFLRFALQLLAPAPLRHGDGSSFFRPLPQ
ncbi:MAG: hypothetical protein RBT86_02600 [Azospira sp.]|jgi:hypothetical protein|nr:hypothetical protein [Azospira sp.]